MRGLGSAVSHFFVMVSSRYHDGTVPGQDGLGWTGKSKKSRISSDQYELYCHRYSVIKVIATEKKLYEYKIQIPEWTRIGNLGPIRRTVDP